MIAEKVVDFFAMDIKTSLPKYKEIIKVGFSENDIKKSKDIIQNSGLPYEFEPRRLREFIRKKFLKKLESGLTERKRILSKILGAKRCCRKNTQKRRFFRKRTAGVKNFNGKACQKLRDKSVGCWTPSVQHPTYFRLFLFLFRLCR